MSKPSPLNSVVARVTERIAERSRDRRAAYLARLESAAGKPRRHRLGCANLAHAFAACGANDKTALRGETQPSIGIVTAYNDMLSAHQPYERYPAMIRESVRAAGGVAQVAGGVPAMCDGVTQGYEGMELSLFSRDVIALATGVALSHATFDGVLCLGICDKIVPGLVIGSLAFGHLPTIFVPAGPMPSGLSNADKAKVRQLYAQGKVGRDELLEAESQAYHAPGTCTFYGTANTNQMLMEIMGLHLPGASFVNPNTPLRDALTDAAARRVVAMTAPGAGTPIGRIVDERALVNGIVGLLATGGSTNHTLHIPAIAAAAGIELNWEDFSELSAVVPLLARVYPNGTADVNRFHQAGGMPFIIGQLIDAGLVHTDISTIHGEGGLEPYRSMPELDEGGALTWTRAATDKSGDPTVVATTAAPFATEGGLRVLTGNLGRGVIKISAVKPEHRLVEAPARVFDSQEAVQVAFRAGELDRDVVVVVRYQGPGANGMPELHKLTPPLGVLQDKGFKVALVTDGRMSGASGKVPAAIHVTPEVKGGGPLGRVRDGDILRLDAEAGTLTALVDTAEWEGRGAPPPPSEDATHGCGRDLFSLFRNNAGPAESGASVLNLLG
ncbi:phosphogluconate dehydratase [Azospirillum sp. TSH100]|uniref:phosphogluconate dehydratase n=1 Tax=Azospirillum sp. TSH100 TaxID=652764 RepID=UPI000D6080DF|nr:phosphogluconate dehydratase [Azospirillum sp. TSH100]PWC73370.1 phosphogluconate dehydratase [Azospirillum sp. TSH100]QCG89797.1 phosphogluconate dehydratase [Azospirillum sp. TSH100]